MLHIEKERLLIVFLLIGFDIVTGIIGAIKNKQLKSSKLRTGLFNKMAIILTIAFSMLLDKSNILNVNTFNFVSIYVYFMECTSIIENIKKLNKNAVPKELENIIKNKEVKE